MKIFYPVPDLDRPSWGVGMIYHHVWLLNKNGFEAYIVHHKNPYKIPYLKLDVPIVYLDQFFLKASANDIMVIPEVCADLKELQKIKCRKIVFVQNAFYIYEGLKNGKTYEELGVECLFYYMPHLQKILSSISTLPLYEMPAFIAPYYFNGLPSDKRKKRILLYPKFDNKEHYIFKRVLEHRLAIKPISSFQKLFHRTEWELIELQNKKHFEIPAEMQKSVFFVSINTTEAFNTSVPEAMASGSINLCFEGYGPADFLRNNENAFVFPNDHIYELADKLVHLIIDYDKEQENLAQIRLEGWKTANNYQIDATEKALINFFKTYQ